MENQTQCAVMNCTSTYLVHSGVDALVLGVYATGKFCYTCASAFAQISFSNQQRKEEYERSSDSIKE